MKRLKYLDIMKGFAIWLVVIGHLIQYNHCVDWINHPVFTWIYSFHMPLFFYISGFLCYKTTHLDSMKDMGTFIVKKTRGLIVPLVVWSIFANRYFLSNTIVPLNWDDCWGIFAERGLWFLKYLYSISLFYGLIHLFSSYWNRKGKLWKDILLDILGFFFLLLCAVVIDKTIFMSTALFYLFFVLGTLVSKYEDLKLMMGRQEIYGLAFVLFCILSTQWRIDDGWIYDFMKIMVSVCSFIVIEKMSKLVENNYIGKVFSVVGKYSLAIYVSHWFLLSIVPSMYWDISGVNSFWVFIIAGGMAMIVMTGCIFFAKMSEQSKWLGFLLYGKKLK